MTTDSPLPSQLSSDYLKFLTIMTMLPNVHVMIAFSSCWFVLAKLNVVVWNNGIGMMLYFIWCCYVFCNLVVCHMMLYILETIFWLELTFGSLSSCLVNLVYLCQWFAACTNIEKCVKVFWVYLSLVLVSIYFPSTVEVFGVDLLRGCTFHAYTFHLNQLGVCAPLF